MDYWRKLWDHLFIISNYRLDVDAPFPKPTPESKISKTTQHLYGKSKISLRTYGRNMEAIIKKVAQYPMPQREIMGKILANHLKKLYLLYNRNTVSDELILNQLKELSGGKQLFSTKEIMKNNGNNNYVPTNNFKKKKSKKRRKKPVPTNL
jgi:spore cortex formation protein SpoVR/YcgB (stage V sporulation)